ncbi:hypothetical protein [Ferruginibacter sp.]
MKNGFSLLALCLFSFTAAAKKLAYPMQVVAGMADLVVTGQISSVSGNTYTFDIDKTIKGIPAKQIIVKMFREWTCDVRAKKAEPGQKLLLFLTKANDSFDIINGSTGEIFINDNKVQFFMIAEKNIQLEEAVTAFKNFISCYTLYNKDFVSFNKIIFNQLKTDSEIAALKKADPITRLLLEEMKGYSIRKLPVNVQRRKSARIFIS